MDRNGNMQGTTEDLGRVERDSSGRQVCSMCHQPAPYLFPGFPIWVCSACVEKLRYTHVNIRNGNLARTVKVAWGIDVYELHAEKGSETHADCIYNPRLYFRSLDWLLAESGYQEV